MEFSKKSPRRNKSSLESGIILGWSHFIYKRYIWSSQDKRNINTINIEYVGLENKLLEVINFINNEFKEALLNYLLNELKNIGM